MIYNCCLNFNYICVIVKKMKDQLNKIMEAEGMTPAKFADEIGVQRSSISHILSGRNKPSYDFITKILNRFSGINADWLLTGEGSMIKSTVQGQSNAIKQPTIFEQNQSKKQEERSDSRLEDEEKNTKVTNVSKDQSYVLKPNEKQKDNLQVTNVNNAKYILVFYPDGTFEQFTSRE